jgi:hypothetical protein
LSAVFRLIKAIVVTVSCGVDKGELVEGETGNKVEIVEVPHPVTKRLTATSEVILTITK